MITFLNTHLEKVLGDSNVSFSFHQHQLVSFYSSSPVPSHSSSRPHESPEHHPPHPSPLSFAHRKFRKIQKNQKIQQSRGCCPPVAHVVLWTLLAMSPLQISAVPICGSFLGQEGLCRSVFAQHQMLQGLIPHRSSQA